MARFRCVGEFQAAVSIVGASPYPAPATTEIHNNTKNIDQISQGFLHSPRRTIAASVARVRKMSEGDKKVQSPHRFTNGSV